MTDLLRMAVEACELTKALDDRDNCEECGGEMMPELCELCFPVADKARLARRAVIEEYQSEHPIRASDGDAASNRKAFLHELSECLKQTDDPKSLCILRALSFLMDRALLMGPTL